MIPSDIEPEVCRLIGEKTGEKVRIRSVSTVSGGCIHNARRLETNAGSWFLKYNKASSLDNFQAEIHGLSLLHARKVIGVPKPLAAGATGGHSFLLMEFLSSGPRKPDFWQAFGSNLADLHRKVSENFGLDRPNYIGALPQINEWNGSWTDFFVESRIEPMLKMASRKGLADRKLRQKFEVLFPMLPDLMPNEPPSLLHGDLWSGNFLTGPSGEAVILDPAVYYGHREAEIAFTRLFGGFSYEFYQAYNEAWPLQAGWEDRVDLFNLYPLMVHVNLFGASYLGQVQSILRRYS